jgi:hypothetical protein
MDEDDDDGGGGGGDGKNKFERFLLERKTFAAFLECNHTFIFKCQKEFKKT